MKKSKLFLNAVALAAVVFASSCKDNEEPVEPVDYSIGLNKTTLHFTSKESSETVTVTSEADWDALEEIDWLTVEKQSGNLIVTVQPSRSLADREGVITVVSSADPEKTAEIQVAQDHGTPKKYDYFAGGIPIEHLSPNGRYAAGEYDETGVVIDLYQIADENYQPAVYPGSEHPELMQGYFVMRGIADNGTPFARSVTADGTTTLKFESVNGRYVSYVVKDGVSTPLESPSTYITGSDYQGVYVDLISEDGKYILGRINADGATWIACKWTLNGTNYVFSEIAPDSVEYVQEPFPKFNKWPEPANINGLSVTGEYSCGALRVPQGGTIFSPISAKYTPYIYKMSDGSVTVLDEEVDSRATFVTDDGTLFCATPYSFPFGGDRTTYVYKNGTKSTFADWVNATYGLTVESNNGLISAVTKDYGVTAWYTYEPA